MHESARSKIRMRAEFRVGTTATRAYLAMFDSDDPKTPIEVPAASALATEKINELSCGLPP